MSCDWTESESHTSISVLEHTVHFETPFRLWVSRGTCETPAILHSTGLCLGLCYPQLVLSLLPTCGSGRELSSCSCCRAIVPPSWIWTRCTCEPSINLLFSKLPWLRCLITVVEKKDSASRFPVISECVLTISPSCGLAVGVACPLRQKHRPGREFYWGRSFAGWCGKGGWADVEQP